MVTEAEEKIGEILKALAESGVERIKVVADAYRNQNDTPHLLLSYKQYSAVAKFCCEEKDDERWLVP